MFVRRRLLLIIALELLLFAVAVGWRVTRPVAPAADISRLTDDQQTELSRLYAGAWSGSAASWSRLANGYLGSGFFPQAESCYRHVLSREPRNIMALYGLALSLSRSGRTSEAIDGFRTFIEVAGPEHADAAWYQIGRCFLREDNAPEAEAAFLQIVRLPEAEIELARLLVRTGRASDGQPIIDGLLARYPRALHVLEVAMNSAKQRQQPRAAAELAARLETSSYQFAMALDVSDVENYRRLAGLSETPSMRETAVPQPETSPPSRLDEMLRQLGKDPNWSKRRKVLPAARAALEADQPETAIRLLDDLFEHSQVTPQTLIAYGDALLALQAPEKAETAWQASLKLLPTADAHQRLADFHAAQGAEAQRTHHTAMAHHFNGLADFREQRFAAALEKFDLAIELDPNNARSWMYLGMTRQRLGQRQAAVESLQQSLELAPFDGDALAALDELQSSN